MFGESGAVECGQLAAWGPSLSAAATGHGINSPESPREERGWLRLRTRGPVHPPTS